ncbi:MAG TPA: hypothetical protein VG123_29625, partial [Streptosporangiaceae bacterium]|nr:hypothetical protein [Streptosporangiaceae bacterium]
WLAEGRLPATRDGGSYVWGFWWLAHQVTRLGDPWFTRLIAAPAGAELGYHALMPLEGLVLAPVTVAFGPAVSYNVLSVLLPGLCCYAMYRAARLWLRTPAGAVAAGGLFGLSSMVTWLAWYQLNLAAGVLFLPLALEAAVRLRRRPGLRQAVLLGLVLAGSLLTDQETAVLTGILVVLVLAPWLAGRPRRDAVSGDPAGGGAPTRTRKLAVTAAAVAVALAAASPQIVAMVVQSRSGGTSFPPREVVENYVSYNPSLSGMFGASPRVLQLGLGALKPVSYTGPITDGIPAFGLVLSVLAVAGLIVSRRRRSAWLLALLWAGAAALALGSTLKIGTRVYVPAAQTWHGVRVSAVLPYTWFVRIPALAGFREAARITLLALAPAALLAGAAVDRLWARAPALIAPVLIAALLEAGWAGNPAIATMPAALPALDAPLAADHSASLVVDVPFGIRGGIPLPGEGAAFNPEAQVLATADGHPRAVGYLSRIPPATLAAIRRHPFYAGLLAAQANQTRRAAEQLARTPGYPALLAAARRDARAMHIGWILLWQHTPAITRYLTAAGFRPDYTADRVLVYRPAVR